MKVVITGSRPFKLGNNAEQVMAREALWAKLDDLKPDLVYTGMALGPDLWALWWCVENQVKVHACIPYPKWAEMWSRDDVTDMAGEISEAYHYGIYTQTIISEEYYPEVYFDRNKYMVNQINEQHDLVLAVWSGQKGGCKYTMDYAKSKGKRVVLVTW